jgi:hypothetical protein
MRKIVRRVLLGLSSVALLAIGAVATTSFQYGGRDGVGCGRCHEIRPMVVAWSDSTHRTVGCKHCHGSSFTADLRMHMKSVQRVWLHSIGKSPEQIHIRHQDVAPLVARCAACHAREAADWGSGPHGATYVTIFLDAEHNARQEPIDDCLRCHAMHFEGGIRDLVTPLDRKGPWRFVRASDAGLSAVPCLACHEVHRNGAPLAARQDREAEEGRDQPIAAPSLAFYDRRAFEHVALDGLPMPVMRDGTRVVKTSPDRRQALCYQCHAPLAGGQVFSGDDRTPTGVHEGLSCAACHAKHGLTTRASCTGCHPRLSNCGLDVETMDTTFKSRASRHDIHRVACLDCHPKGVPARRNPVSAPRQRSPSSAHSRPSAKGSGP